MLEALERAWRIVATGLSFLIFGFGGFLLWVLFFPLLQLFVREPARRQRLARRSVHHSFRFFIGFTRWVGILDYRIEGRERLDRRGLLILANHPTLIDVVFLVSLIPDADCVVKASLARNPFTRGPVRATGYLCNDSGPGLVADCIDSVKRGNNLILFPEGTRTPIDGRPVRLQRGAANIAVRGPCDITPVRIRCEPIGLSKGVPWWKVPPSKMQFTIQVEEDLPVAPFLASQGEAAAARRVTEYLTGYFIGGRAPDAAA